MPAQAFRHFVLSHFSVSQHHLHGTTPPYPHFLLHHLSPTTLDSQILFDLVLPHLGSRLQ